MNPLNFVGTPDWRSAVLAVVWAAPWLVLLAGRWLRRAWTWAALVAGLVTFPLSIAWGQVPLQQVLNVLYASILSPEMLRRYLWLWNIPGVVVSGLVQETTKFGIGVAGLRLIDERRSRRAGLALGAVAGAGYGAIEAFWVFNLIFATGFTWATVQLSGAGALIGFVERFFTVMFHTAAAALSVYGYATGRPWRFLLLAIGIHSLINYFAILVQIGMVGLVVGEIVIAVIAVITLVVMLRLCARGREMPTVPELEL